MTLVWPLRALEAKPTMAPMDNGGALSGSQNGNMSETNKDSLLETSGRGVHLQKPHPQCGAGDRFQNRKAVLHSKLTAEPKKVASAQG